MAVKKPSRRAMLMNAVQEIEDSKRPLPEKVSAFYELMRTQTFLKNPGGKFGNAEIIFDMECEKLLNQYLEKGADETSCYWSEYYEGAISRLRGYRSLWNDVFHLYPRILDVRPYQIFTSRSKNYRKKLMKRFGELHPDMVQADSLLTALYEMSKYGVRCEETENHLKRLTNNYDMEVMKNLTCAIEHEEILKFAEKLKEGQ